MAIQPKNTNDILADNLDEKTAAAGVILQGIMKLVKGATKQLIPQAATVDIGTSTAAQHIQEVFAKELTSNGQALTLGTDSDHAVNVKANGITVISATDDGIGTLYLLCANTLTATGTIISNALDLTAIINVLTTVAAGTGVQLADTGFQVAVNAGANALAVYGHSGAATLNNGVAGASVSVATGALVLCFRDGATNWVVREITAPAA